MKIKLLVITSILFATFLTSEAQVSPCTTVDYNLQGYPKTVRYMKFEADTSLKQQRVSYIEDYQLNFNENRQLTERINFINGNRDRTTFYEYNNKRQLVKETIKEKDGRVASTTLYTYNNIGRLATLTEISYPDSRGGANRVERTEVYTYNSKGLLSEKNITGDNIYANRKIEYFYGPADSLISTITTYEYNSNVEKLTVKRAFNNFAMEKIWSRNEQMTRRETYDYNPNGMLAIKEVFNAQNKKLLSYTYKYDEHFNVTEEKAIDSRQVKSIDYSYEYTKDKFFNWTKRIMYDSWAVKYTEIRTIEYYDKTHFYDDQKDFDQKKVIRDDEEKTMNRTREYKDQPVNQH